jgi:hypothetical protein
MTSITKLNDNRKDCLEYDDGNNNKNIESDNETIITLKLSKKHYKTAWVLAHMLGYESLDEYVSYVLRRDIEKEIKQGEIDLDIAKLF